MSNTPLVKTIFLPSLLAPSTNATASLLVTELDAAVECPRVIGTIDADVADLRLDAEGIEQAVIVVGVAVGLMRGQVEAIRPFDEIELVDPEGDDGSAFNLGRLKLFEVGVRAVDTHVVGVEQAKTKH